MKEKGITNILIVLGVLVVTSILIIIVLNNQQLKEKSFNIPSSVFNNHSQISQVQPRTKDHEESQQGGYGFKKPFYDQNRLSLQQYWPGEGSFSNEETEILLFNDSNSTIQIKSYEIEYIVEGKNYPQKSGTWEKFPSRQSWDKIEYLNISPQYYKSEPLLLTSGQKAKLHWHIAFGQQAITGRQTVTLKLTLLQDGQTFNIEKEFNRESGTVFSKDNH